MSERFGRYHLLARIGAGGMAEVFRARLEAPGGAEKILVIKRIRAAAREEPSLLRRFADEARIALPLSHDNITSVFEFGEIDGRYFLAMEHVRGQDFASVLRRAREIRGRLPPALALFVAAQVAKGLAYAHRVESPEGEPLGIVHLDVSPQNILVSYDGAVKLTDFGIARTLGAAPGAAEGGPVIGKAAYVAPERVRGGPVDGRADVYALGCVLYESLVGRPPHGGGADEEVLRRVHAGKIDPPSRLDAALAPFDSLVLGALAPDPADRYPDADGFHAALSRELLALAPGFDSPQLGRWMREAFVDEIRPAGRPADRAARLAAAGFDPKDEVTVELIDAAALAVPGAAEAPARERRRRRWTRSLVGTVAVAALAAVGAIVAPHLTGAAPAAPPLPMGTATLSLHSWPSAQVELDGARLAGRTPIVELELAPGGHRLVFTHPELGLRKELDVHLEAGTTRTVVVTLR